LRKIKKKLQEFSNQIKKRLDKIHPPGFRGMSFLQVLQFFGKGIKHGSITIRASSIAYKFFIALIPAILFLLCFIPYIPIDGFQNTLIDFLRNVFPPNIYIYIDDAIIEVVTKQRPDLLSVGFFMALFFSVNGMNSVMHSFNESYHKTDNRSQLVQYLISFMLVIILALLAIIIIASVNLTENVLQTMLEEGLIQKKITFYLLKYGKWIVILFFMFTSISLTYFFAPSHRKKFKEILPGSILASILSVFVSLGLNYFISNVARFNEFFGSIGTLIVTLLWIYYNSIILLLGFEFNISIVNAVKSKKNDV